MTERSSMKSDGLKHDLKIFQSKVCNSGVVLLAIFGSSFGVVYWGIW